MPLFRLQRRSQQGFALLITVTLLAFLVLLLVSLAALTRVETQVASNATQLAKARQNALFALNVAMGQLQLYAGPDQRTTARSDLDQTIAAQDATLVANSGTLPTVSGRWTGVYGNRAEANYEDKPSDAAAKIVAAGDGTNGSQARLINWLVSGNEGTAFSDADVDPANGRIATPAPVPAFVPTTALTDLASTAPKIGGQHAAQLVGRKSAAHAGDYVYAPLRPLAGPVAGLGGADAPIGRYAWWVGDEGARARINLPMQNGAPAFVASQRAAVEFVDKTFPAGSTDPGAMQLAGMIDSAYDPANAQLPQLLAAEQLPLMNATEAATFEAARRLRFHDLTAASSSVLSDAYAGGLKRDLSALFAINATSPADTDLLFPPEISGHTGAPNDSGAMTDADSGFGIPTWGMLRSFARITASSPELAAASTVAFPPGISTPPVTVSIAPVLTRMDLGFQYAAPAPGQPIKFAVFPVVVLWNPYSVPIASGKRYEVGFARVYRDDLFQLQRWDGTKWVHIETRMLTQGGRRPNLASSSNDTHLRFIVDVGPQGILPGQSVIFTVAPSDSGSSYNAAPVATNVLRPGFNPATHFLMPYTSTAMGGTMPPSQVPGEPDDYRVASKPPQQITDGSNGAISNYLQNFHGGYVGGYLGLEASSSSALPTSRDFRLTQTDKHWLQRIANVYPGNGPSDGLLVRAAPLPTAIFQPQFLMTLGRSFSTGTERWLALSNPRASLLSRVAKYGSGMEATVFGIGAGVRFNGAFTWPLLQPLAAPGTYASSGAKIAAVNDQVIESVLFEFRPDNQPFMTLGQLQHANLSMLVSYPAYALGNSLANPRFSGESTKPNARDKVAFTFPQNADTFPAKHVRGYYDLSWLLNRALQDRYFVSTVPHPGTGVQGVTATDPVPLTLPNTRHVRLSGANGTNLKNADLAAANLMLAGGFNINSTSEQAWRAVLGGVNRLEYDPVSGGSGPVLRPAFSRFSKPTKPAAGSSPDSAQWQGYRQLTEQQIAQLARDIVAQVRLRGPFVSLGDFINRRLKYGPSTAKTEAQLKGALQAALDTATSGAGATNPASATRYPTKPLYTDPYISTEIHRGSLTAEVSPYSSPAAFAPDMVTQADVLSVIGAGLSARSDTFVIRTYGEVLDPLNSSDANPVVTGKAWCEAVVQRMPEYVNPSENNPEDRRALLTDINRRFGRQFKIVSFRWLSPDDI